MPADPAHQTTEAPTRAELVEAMARAIFRVMKPSNMHNSDWDTGAILGKDNALRDTIITAASDALDASLLEKA